MTYFYLIFSKAISFQLTFCTEFLICIHITNLICLRSLFRYILQMYQGVFTQCSGVAHKSRFSDFFQSAESFLFTFQYLHLWGIISIPILMHMGHLPSHNFLNYLLLCKRHSPSHTISMGHSLFPLLAALIAHYISHSYGVYKFTWGTFPSHFIMEYLACPFNNFLDSWGTCPSHSHLQL